MSPEEPWYERAFAAGYLDLYAHRDAASARAEAGGLLERGLAPDGTRLLDLACGAGRHAVAFRAAGVDVFGLDLSADLLAHADPALTGRLVRGDVRRLPFAAGAFGAVAMLFSSWGYFEEGDNAAVLAGIGRVLAPGGTLLLDLMNADRIRRTLVPESHDRVDGRTVVQRRSLRAQGRRVVKRVTVIEPDGTERSWHEDVRMYGPNELEAVLLFAGFRLERLEGDFDGRPFGEDAPRMIAWARRRTVRAEVAR